MRARAAESFLHSRRRQRTYRPVTLPTSHAPMFALNVAQPLVKSCDRLVTRETSHDSIAPYVARAALGSRHHALAAVLSALLLVKV